MIAIVIKRDPNIRALKMRRFSIHLGVYIRVHGFRGFGGLYGG